MKKIYLHSDLINRSILKSNITNIESPQVLLLGSKNCVEPNIIKQFCNPNITLVNKDEESLLSIKKICGENINLIHSPFESYDFPEEKFDLIIAINSLPFIKKESFAHVISKMKTSLNEKGIFCATFFGQRDQWALDSSSIKTNFHTKNDLFNLFENMQVEFFAESEYRGSTYAGEDKHWHIYSIILKK